MVEKIRLTKTSVEAITPPAAGELLVWDSDLKGFGVRVSAAGRRTYFIYGRTKAGRQVKAKVGVHGQITAEKARSNARIEIGKLTAGQDPAQERIEAKRAEAKRLGALTMAELCDKYLTEYAEVHKRESSIRDDRSIAKMVKAKFGSRKVEEITHDDIASFHASLKSRPARANRVIAMMSKMFSLAVQQWKLRPDNPVKGVQRYQEEPRERYLQADELGRLSKALTDSTNATSANAVRLLLLTGARRGETLSATWEQFDREPGVWIKPSAHTKQKKEHRVPLSPPALQLLDEMRKLNADRKPSPSPYVFPGRGRDEPLTDIKKFWASVCKTANISGVRLHDLRHTYASVLAGSGYSLPIIGALLGHTQAATTQRYSHLADNPLREATTRVGEQLAAFAAGKTADVVALRKA